MMEVVPPGAYGNFHYHNLAYWNQVQYRPVSLMGNQYGESCTEPFKALLLEVARLNDKNSTT
jgi:hypothetical protein